VSKNSSPFIAFILPHSPSFFAGLPPFRAMRGLFAAVYGLHNRPSLFLKKEKGGTCQKKIGRIPPFTTVFNRLFNCKKAQNNQQKQHPIQKQL
jgi:hypothetical protein